MPMRKIDPTILTIAIVAPSSTVSPLNAEVDHLTGERRSSDPRIPIGTALRRRVLPRLSPERIDPGNVTWRLRNTPKVVEGVDELSAELATSFYRKVRVVVVEAPRTRGAELAKSLENVAKYRLHATLDAI